MALIHHKVLKDGSFVHEDFTKEAWELAMHDPDVASHWGHRPDDCHDPVARHWARLRRQGYPCGPKQHAYADREDPGWMGNRGEIEPVKTTEPSPPPPEPTVWPPAVPLTPRFLSEMTGLCVDDCKDIMSPPRKQQPPSEPKPLVNKRGQYLLF